MNAERNYTKECFRVTVENSLGVKIYFARELCMTKIKQLLSILAVISLFVLPAVSKVCPPGDLNGDCYIDFYDISVMAQQWLNPDCSEQGLTSYWQFDENTGNVAHDSAGENHASIIGATWEKGKSGTALNFGSYGDCVDIPNLDLSGTWTICFWVNAHSKAASAVGSMVFGNANEINNYFRIIPNYNARLRNNAGQDVIWSNDSDFCERWRLVTIVADQTGIELYLDGMSQGKTQVSTEFKLYHIGRGHTNNTYDFYGLIDEFKVYNRSLSAEEILALAKTGTSVLNCGNLNGTDGINMDDYALLSENWQTRGPDIVINEFMASNSDTLSTVVEDQTIFPDWIELYNQTQDSIDLSGWYLTDNIIDVDGYWRIPDGVTIDADEYMIIFASGLDTADSNGYLHTNFKLDVDGEYIGLIRPDKQSIAFDYTYGYPQQYMDISFGMNGDIDNPVYFGTATPGAVNAIATAIMPTIVQPGRFFSGNLVVEIRKATPEDTVRYTLNGNDPTEDSAVYTDAITITNTITLKAASFRSGYEMSPIACEKYSKLNADVLGFSSNLPILIVDTFNTEIPIPPDRKTSVPKVLTLSTVININSTGRASITDEPEYKGRAGISIRGSSSEYFPKKMYHLETWNMYNQDTDVEFLDLPKESDWVLYAPYTDKTMMRNALSYKWWADTGRYSVRTRFVEMFLNVDDSSVSLSDYVGVYVIEEKIKRDENRVNIAKLSRWDNEEPEVTGGYMIKRDRADPNDFGFGCMLGYVYYVEPKEEEVTPQQATWIQQYISHYETVLKSTYMADPNNGYAKYIDVDSFLDYQLFNEILKDADAYGLSTFMYKDRGGKLTMGPVWDHNLSLGNAFYGGGGGSYNPVGWNWQDQGIPYDWYRKLFLDPEFQLQHADHWWHLRNTVFDVNNIMDDIDGFAEVLRESADRNFNRWKIWVDPNLESPLPEGTEPHVWDEPNIQPYWIEVSILNGWVWPNKYFGTPKNPRTYQDEINWMKGWIVDRINWMDSQFVKPPIFNQQGGQIDIGFELTITKPDGVSGKIYYTIDGTDPHRISQSSPTASAIEYTGPITMTKSVEIQARVLDGTKWLPLNKATFSVGLVTDNLRITEIMYHPQDEPDGDPNAEFIELKNIGTEDINLNFVNFTNGIYFTFGDITLAAGGYIVVIKDTSAFEAQYGSSINIAGVYDGSLSNGGETLALEDATGNTIQEFKYRDNWYPTTDGNGYSLTIINPANSDLQSWSLPGAWRPSYIIGGTPGTD